MRLLGHIALSRSPQFLYQSLKWLKRFYLIPIPKFKPSLKDLNSILNLFKSNPFMIKYCDLLSLDHQIPLTSIYFYSLI